MKRQTGNNDFRAYFRFRLPEMSNYGLAEGGITPPVYSGLLLLEEFNVSWN